MKSSFTVYMVFMKDFSYARRSYETTKLTKTIIEKDFVGFVVMFYILSKSLFKLATFPTTKYPGLSLLTY